MVIYFTSSKKPGRTAPQPFSYLLKSCVKKVAALVPPSNSRLTRYSGVFSSHSKWRDKVVPCPEKRTGFCPDARGDAAADRKKVKNHRWAKLLARTFKVDVGTCPKCGEDMEIMGAVQGLGEVQRYLRHVGMKEHPPPIAPAYRPVDCILSRLLPTILQIDRTRGRSLVGLGCTPSPVTLGEAP